MHIVSKVSRELPWPFCSSSRGTSSYLAFFLVQAEVHPAKRKRQAARVVFHLQEHILLPQLSQSFCPSQLNELPSLESFNMSAEARTFRFAVSLAGRRWRVQHLWGRQHSRYSWVVRLASSDSDFREQLASRMLLPILHPSRNFK